MFHLENIPVAIVYSTEASNYRYNITWQIKKTRLVSVLRLINPNAKQVLTKVANIPNSQNNKTHFQILFKAKNKYINKRILDKPINRRTKMTQ